jgi:hypothetical protein
MQYAQAQVGFEGVEVAVIVQQLVAFFDAEGSDDAVDRLAYGDSPALQFAKVLSGANRQFGGHGRKNLKSPESFFGLAKVPVKTNALENFTENQTGEADLFPTQRHPKPSRLRGDLSVQCIDPDTAVDNHHAAFALSEFAS